MCAKRYCTRDTRHVTPSKVTGTSEVLAGELLKTNYFKQRTNTPAKPIEFQEGWGFTTENLL